MSHEHYNVSNHKHLHCLCNRFFNLTTKKTKKLTYWPFCAGKKHCWLTDSPHKGPVMRKACPYHDATKEANRPVSEIPQYTSPISHNAPLCNRNVHMCAHIYHKMVHYGIYVWCIVGLVRCVYCHHVPPSLLLTAISCSPVKRKQNILSHGWVTGIHNSFK